MRLMSWNRYNRAERREREQRKRRVEMEGRDEKA